MNRLDIIKFERLRLGHTKLTHEDLMANNQLTFCIFCNSGFPVSLEHIFKDCNHFAHQIRQFFGNKDPIEHLANPTEDIIINFIKFLKASKLYYKL